MDWQNYITVDPNVCHGQACLKGTRVMAVGGARQPGGGVNARRNLKSYPSLNTRGDSERP